MNDRTINMTEPSQKLDQLAHSVIGAAIEVHRLLGPGFLESVYEEAMCVELQSLRIPFKRQAVIVVDYKGHSVGEGRMDLLVDNALVVELKAIDSLLPIHKAQILSYLKATGHQLGLLMKY